MKEVNEVDEEIEVGPGNNEVIDDDDELQEDEFNEKEFHNDFIDKYKFKNKIDPNTTVAFQLYEHMSKGILAISQVFPEFDPDIIGTSVEFNTFVANSAKMKKNMVYLPNMDINPQNDAVYLVSDPNIVQQMKDYQAKYDAHLEKISAVYTPDKFPLEARLLKIAKNNADIMKDPDAYELFSGFSEYLFTFKTSVMDMPSPEFVSEIRNGKKVYSVDIPRYREFMKNHVFLEQLEDKQNFFMNEYIPYAKKQRAGKLTAVDAERYNAAYASHMMRQKRYYEEITGYTHENDPEIAANKVCNNKSQFEMNWKGQRFGQHILATATGNLELMDKGWPAADMTFLNQLKKMKKDVDEFAANTSKKLNAAEIDAAKRIKKKMKSAYENIMNKKVTSPEDRMAKLLGIEESVKEYTTLINGFRKRTLKNIGPASIEWLFDEAKGRRVFRTEVGKGKYLNDQLKTSTFIETNRYGMQIGSGVREADKDAYQDSDIYRDLDEFDKQGNGEALNDKAFVPYNDADRKLEVPMGVPQRIEVVQDKAVYKKVKENYIKNADFIDKKMNEYYKDDEIGKEIKAFIKARISDRLRRNANGRSNLVLVNKTPLGNGINCVTDAVWVEHENDFLRNNIKKWQDRFPVFKLAVEGERQLQTLADYYDEKEKAGGTLSPEKEKEYRQKLYDQTVMMLPMMNKVFASVENKKIHDELQKDKVIMDDQFCIHPAAQRGAKTLCASLNAYKTGLENGWALDDIPMMAAFNLIVLGMDVKVTVGLTLKLDGYEKKKPIAYASEQEKEYFDKMRKLSEEMKTKAIKSAKDRDYFINKMISLIDEGIENRMLFSDGKTMQEVRYFKQLQNRQLERSINIGMGREPAYYNEPVIVSPDRKIATFMSDLTAARTDKWWSKESTVHENLRKAAEALQTFIKDNPAPANDADKKTVVEYSAKYLAKLDAVQHYSKLYQEARTGASTQGGKERLRGAKDIFSFASREKLDIMEKLKGVTKAYSDIKDFRKAVVVDRMSSATQKLAAMNAMPITPAAKKKIIDMAADIMVGRFAASNTVGGKVFNDMGFDVMKSSIVNGSEFKRMMDTYMKDETMTPKKMAEELTGDGIMRRFKSSEKSIKEFEGKLNDRAAKQEAAEEKYQRHENKIVADEAKKKAAEDAKKVKKSASKK